MEFKFSNEEEVWHWAVKDFAERELGSRDLNSLDSVPQDLKRKMGDLGFFSLRIPEEYGGNPASFVMIGLLAEEMAKVNIAIAYFIMVSYEITLPLADHGVVEARREWLPQMVSGQKSGCVSVTEPDAGSDLASIRTRAIRDRDDYVLNGQKTPVSFGMEADIALLFAKTSSDKGSEGLTSFLIPLHIPGIKRLPLRNMGLFLTHPCSLLLEEVRVPRLYRIGEEGQGFSIARETGPFTDLHQVLSGLICLGAAQNAMRLTISYSRQRFAFGRPIARFEAISGKIAEVLTFIEAARWLCYRALVLKDQGLPNVKEAAMCGWWCPKVAFRVIEDALLIHGHAGYSDDHPFQQMLRDVAAFELIAGTEEILKLGIAQKAIGDTAIPDNLSGMFCR